MSRLMELAKFRLHVNGHAMFLRETCFENPNITNISDVLRS